jgi:hypothetical protein
MQNMIETLINGNLSTARKLAKRFRQDKIYHFLMEDCGWSESKSYACAMYLKTGDGFQRYCDAE